MEKTSQTILVTGASGGIGAATSKQAAANGYRVVVHYHQAQDTARQLLEELHSVGAEAVMLQADLSKEHEVQKLFTSIDATFGSLDAVVNNAGMLDTQMRVVDMNADRLQRVFNSNVLNYFLCCKEAVQRMSSLSGGQGGAIVNVSSIASRLGSAGEYVDYAAAKGAIDTLTRGLAVEVAEESIRVNAVRPGVIDTPIHARGGEPDRPQRVRSVIPLKRAGTPDEVAHAIMWLLSDQASYVTGTILDVGGGR